MKEETLLTNEPLSLSDNHDIEIVTFIIDNNLFGININCVLEIIPVVDVFKIPLTHPHIEGVISVRNEVLPVINLAKVLRFSESYPPDQERFLIAELHQQKIALHVERMSHLYKVPTHEIKRIAEIDETIVYQELLSGVCFVNNQKIKLLDFETIIKEINPSLTKKNTISR